MRLSIAGLALMLLLRPAAMLAQPIVSIRVTHHTRNIKYAKTDDDFLLEFWQPGRVCNNVAFPNLSHDEREPGATDSYPINVAACGLSYPGLSASQLSIRTLGRNAWSPDMIHVEVVLNDGTTKELRSGKWDTKYWFSTDPTDRTHPEGAFASLPLGGPLPTPSLEATSLTVGFSQSACQNPPQQLRIYGKVDRPIQPNTKGVPNFDVTVAATIREDIGCSGTVHVPGIQRGTWSITAAYPINPPAPGCPGVIVPRTTGDAVFWFRATGRPSCAGLK